ncbi:MAG: metallophosphoesterase [Chloroflexi bacterium]|nr:metallophosphoesterase [Chloroflexota bacterium]
MTYVNFLNRSHTVLSQLTLFMAVAAVAAACTLGAANTAAPTPSLSDVTATATPPVPASTSRPSLTPEDFKIAFIGDQDINSDSKAVLGMIRDEGADMVLHQGDLGYSNGADAWDEMISDTLGADFPYFASIGNHDCTVLGGCSGPGVWPDYQARLQQRLDLIEGATCVGDLGINSACTYKGIFFVLSGVGTRGSGHLAFLTDALVSDTSTWQICSWHKNQTKMQVGGKGNETGWEVYEACRSAGAIIATAHEHSYSRTHLMSDFESQIVATKSGPLRLQPGFSFAFVSGLGGRGVRDEDDGRGGNPWWASVYTSSNGATFGALFCEFNYRSATENAHCYFKPIDGAIVDEFDLIAS